MTRGLATVLLLLLAGLGSFLAYSAAQREAEYRRLVAQGQAALDSDQTFVAVEAFSGAIALKGTSMLAHLRRGETYRRRGEFGAALRDLRTAARLDPTAPRPLEQLGDVNYAMDRFARAAESYESYLQLDDHSPAVLYKLALARFRGGDAPGAIAAVEQAIALRDRFPEAHYLHGLCLVEVKRPEDAIRALERAVALAPWLTAPRETLATVYQTVHAEAKAIQQLEALAALDPDRAERQVAVGLAYASMGRTDLAVISLGQAAERHPNQPDVYQALGRVWIEAAEPRRDRVALSKALEALDRVARGPAATSEGMALLGRALLLNGDAPEAERVLQQAVTRFPVDPAAFLHLANASLRLGHVEEARDALIQHAAIAETEQEVARVAPQIADLSLRLGKPAEAVRWFTRAIETGGETAPALARLADAQLRAGDIEGARQSVARGLAKDAANVALHALRRRLPS